MFKNPPWKVSSTTRACLDQTGAGWCLTPLEAPWRRRRGSVRPRKTFGPKPRPARLDRVGVTTNLLHRARDLLHRPHHLLLLSWTVPLVEREGSQSVLDYTQQQVAAQPSLEPKLFVTETAPSRLMDKMMHHPKRPWRGSRRNGCAKKERTWPPAPPDLNVGDTQISVWGGATILSFRGNTPVPSTLRSGGGGGRSVSSKEDSSPPAPLP